MNNDHTLSITTQSTVNALLQSGRDQMAHFNFVKAASMFAKAAAALRAASAAASLQQTADWTASHVTWWSTH